MKAPAALAVAACVSLAPVVRAGGTVQWGLQKSHNPEYKVHRRQSGTQEEEIVNSINRGGYFATCSLGTPGQYVALQVDTGSSDIWVPWNEASVCNKNNCDLGTFNPNDSSTYEDTGDVFEISYADGTQSSGNYFRDTFQIANTTVSNLTMGLGQNTSIAYGLVGVGFSKNEAIIDTEQSLDAAYANLPQLMMEQGIIATNAYSLWLNDLDASTGNILFGGIDTEKYVGDLTKIPIVQNNKTGQYDSFIVQLTSLHAVSSSGTDTLTSRDFPIKLVLDSGTTLSYLPNDIAEQVWKEAGAVYMESTGLALIPCRMQSSTGYFSFGFAGPNGPQINVTMDELVLDLVTSGLAPTFSTGEYKGEDACEFGIQNTTGTNLLGDTFLRSAYVVYDLQNNEIGIAATDFNAIESNIVAFESKGASIPSATTAPNDTLATATSAFTEPAYEAESGFSNGTESAAVAVGVPVGLAVTGLVTAMSFLGGGLLFLE